MNGVTIQSTPQDIIDLAPISKQHPSNKVPFPFPLAANSESSKLLSVIRPWLKQDARDIGGRRMHHGFIKGVLWNFEILNNTVHMLWIRTSRNCRKLCGVLVFFHCILIIWTWRFGKEKLSIQFNKLLAFLELVDSKNEIHFLYEYES